jgi:RNA polymerase sigma-70 factor (ECF subfamily)
VLTIVDGKVSHVGAFFGSALFETFGLPATLPASYVPSGCTPA